MIQTTGKANSIKALTKEISRLERENNRLKERADTYRKKYRWYKTLFDFGADPFVVHTYQPAPDVEKHNWLRKLNKKQKIVEVNKAFTKVMGYTKKQAISLSVDDLDKSDGQTDEQRNEIFKKFTLHPKNNIPNLETIHHDISGKAIPMELKIRFLTMDDKTYVITLVRDISERKKLEVAMKQSYLAEKRHSEDLQREINTRIEFTRSLVHELKTPLTPILSSSEALAKMKPASTIQGELAKNIYRGALGLNIRINELLDLAKLEISELTLHKREFPLKIIIEEVIAEMKQRIISCGQNITLDTPKELPIISVDLDRLKQVLRNLLDNAIKYNKGKGRIFVKAEVIDKYVRIEVRDQGKGITKKDQKYIFQPYFRCEEDRGRLDGLGLGLALSKHLVELHGGAIDLKSVRGRGTAIIFMLPIVNEETGKVNNERT